LGGEYRCEQEQRGANQLEQQMLWSPDVIMSSEKGIQLGGKERRSSA
jgi:hypothetical protein